MIQEKNIVYENSGHWVLKDEKADRYVVFQNAHTHSISDSAYALDADGLSLAKARCDHLARGKQP